MQLIYVFELPWPPSWGFDRGALPAAWVTAVAAYRRHWSRTRCRHERAGPLHWRADDDTLAPADQERLLAPILVTPEGAALLDYKAQLLELARDTRVGLGDAGDAANEAPPRHPTPSPTGPADTADNGEHVSGEGGGGEGN